MKLTALLLTTFALATSTLATGCDKNLAALAPLAQKASAMQGQVGGWLEKKAHELEGKASNWAAAAQRELDKIGDDSPAFVGGDEANAFIGEGNDGKLDLDMAIRGAESFVDDGVNPGAQE